MRELIDRYGLGETIVAVFGAITAVVIVAVGFDFEVSEVAEVLLTTSLVALLMGGFAGLAWIVGRILDALTRDPVDPD
ncbi:MAG: hypothetical protein WD904_02385 [Dehalococcoidia bacterium]